MKLQLKASFEASLGANLSQEIEDMLESVTTLLDENFRQLGSDLDELDIKK